MVELVVVVIVVVMEDVLVVIKGVSHQVWPSAKIGKCIATL